MVAMDVFAHAFGLDSKSDDVWTVLGKVTAINGNKLSVLLGGSATPTECESYCLADVGDIVFVVISKGKARAVAVKGGGEKKLDANFYVKRTYVDSTLSNNGITAASYRYFGFLDKNDLYTGWAGNIAYTDGTMQTQLASRKRINNANVENILRLNVQADGTKTVSMSDPGAWLTALGIGTTYEANKDSLSTAAGQDTYTQGAKITLPAGKYIIYTQWAFNTGSGTTCSTTVGIGYSSGIWTDSRDRVWQSGPNWIAHTTTYVCTLTVQNDIYSYGSSSIARTGCGSFIRAIKVG